MAKADAPPAAPAPAAVPAPPPAPAAPAGRGVMSAWLPVFAALVLAPASTWLTVEYVLLPHLQKKLAATPVAETTANAAPQAETPGATGARGDTPRYEFNNIVVNLAGTMGTRYLKTSFMVTGVDPSIKMTFESAKPRLTDVTLNILSS